MSGQEVCTQVDPLFESLEKWQRENPVRRRITSADLEQEEGNFITYCGRFRRKRPASRVPDATNINDFQLEDCRGIVFIRPTKFISTGEIRKVSERTHSSKQEKTFDLIIYSDESWGVL